MSTVPPLDPSDLDRPDEELGKLVLGLFLFAEAEQQGISPTEIPETWANQVVSKIKEIPPQSPKNDPIAIALRYAARGKFAKAGRVLKEHCDPALENSEIFASLIEELDTHLQNRKKGAKEAAKTKKHEKAQNDLRIIGEADKLLKAGRKPRELSRIISTTTGFSADHIRIVLKKAGRR